jgi:hypothetical protein
MTIAHEWLSDETILVISPQGPLESDDFDELAKQVDERLRDIVLRIISSTPR